MLNGDMWNLGHSYQSFDSQKRACQWTMWNSTRRVFVHVLCFSWSFFSSFFSVERFLVLNLKSHNNYGCSNSTDKSWTAKIHFCLLFLIDFFNDCNRIFWSKLTFGQLWARTNIQISNVSIWMWCHELKSLSL